MSSLQSNPVKWQSREEYEQLSYFIRRPEVIRVLRKKGISYFFPIQYQTFDAINFGSDLIGKDRTGSGKTVAYALPILQRLRDQQLLNRTSAKPKFLIVLPTRELAIQVKNQIQSLKITPKEFNVIAVYGGSPVGLQCQAIQNGVDVISATPGRLIDLLERKAINLSQIQSICLDQADEMLKQGFQEDVQRILKFLGQHSPIRTQKLLFSATVPRWVQELAAKFMNKSRKIVDLIKKHEIKTSKTIQHLSILLGNNSRSLFETIRKLIGIYAGQNGSVIIFCETKREVNQIHRSLDLPQSKNILHGDVAQFNRQIIFRDFKQGILKCLIATNVAARGLDIPSVDLIIQLQPPSKADDYVHRSGRTGRAGKNGVCVTFYRRNQAYLMKEIEKVATIRFRNIGQPKEIDLLKTKTQDIVSRIRSIDEEVAEYFQDTARQLINEKGAEKALALALAELAGLKQKVQEFSMQTKQPGFLSYIFSTDSQKVTNESLKEFLSNRLLRFNHEDICQVNFLTNRAMVFDVPAEYKKQMQEVILHLEKKESILEEIYQLKLVTNEEMINNFSDNQLQYTIEEYQQAKYNQDQLEVYIRGFSSDADEDAILTLFKNNNVRAIQLKLPRDRGMVLGYGYLLCVNEEEKQKAIELSGELVINNRNIYIQQCRKHKK